MNVKIFSIKINILGAYTQYLHNPWSAFCSVKFFKNGDQIDFLFFSQMKHLFFLTISDSVIKE